MYILRLSCSGYFVLFIIPNEIWASLTHSAARAYNASPMNDWSFLRIAKSTLPRFLSFLYYEKIFRNSTKIVQESKYTKVFLEFPNLIFDSIFTISPVLTTNISFVSPFIQDSIHDRTHWIPMFWKKQTLDGGVWHSIFTCSLFPFLQF